MSTQPDWYVFINMGGRWQLIRTFALREDAYKCASEMSSYYGNRYEVRVSLEDMRFNNQSTNPPKPFWKSWSKIWR